MFGAQTTNVLQKGTVYLAVMFFLFSFLTWVVGSFWFINLLSSSPLLVLLSNGHFVEGDMIGVSWSGVELSPPSWPSFRCFHSQQRERPAFGGKRGPRRWGWERF